MLMNRRAAFRALGSGALGVLALPQSTSAALPLADCSPANAEGIFERDIRCLPKGLVAVTLPTGEVVEIVVPSSGITTLGFQTQSLLRGLWETTKPGTFIQQKPIVGAHPLVSSFNGPVDQFEPKVPGTVVLWVYRHPLDVPGTILKGVNNSQMYLQVDTGSASVGPLTVDLVEFAVGFGVRDSSDLREIPYPPFPEVESILETWTLPAGRGNRRIDVDPITIPWNARLLGLIRRTPIPAGYAGWKVYIRLRSVLGPLEIVATS